MTLAKQQREKAAIDAGNYAKAGARLLSKQRAGMGASGFMADDPTAEEVMTDTVKELSLQELTIAAMGENEARTTEYGGMLAKQQGEMAKRSSRLMALGQAVGGFTSWRDLYGGGSGGGGSTTLPRSNGQVPRLMAG